MKNAIPRLLPALLLCCLCACSRSASQENVPAEQNEPYQQEADMPADDTQQTVTDSQADIANTAQPTTISTDLSTEERLYWENAYASVLNQYYDAVTEEWDEDDISGTMVSSFALYEDLDTLGYAFSDIDNDGTYELLVGLTYVQEDPDYVGFVLLLYKLPDDDLIAQCALSKETDDYESYSFLCTDGKSKTITYWYGSDQTQRVVTDFSQGEKVRFMFYPDYAENGFDTPYLYKKFDYYADEFMIDYTALSEDDADEFLNNFDAMEPVYIDYIPLSEYQPVNLPIDDAGHLYESEDDCWIVDDDGNTVASVSNGDFTQVISYGDGYYMLYRDSSGFDAAVYEVGMMKYDGTWLWEYGTILNDFVWASYSIDLIDVLYLGNGMFEYWDSDDILTYPTVADVHILSCSNETKYTIPNVVISRNGVTIAERFEQPLSNAVSQGIEYICFEQSTDRKSFHHIIVDLYTGEILTDLGDDIVAIGNYSDGGFVFKRDNQLYFYDCASRTTSTLYLKDSDKFSDTDYQFVDGELRIWLIGADDNKYYATVDKNGNYVMEPQLVD
jgi:hypothetical protein